MEIKKRYTCWKGISARTSSKHWHVQMGRYHEIVVWKTIMVYKTCKSITFFRGFSYPHLYWEAVHLHHLTDQSHVLMPTHRNVWEIRPLKFAQQKYSIVDFSNVSGRALLEHFKPLMTRYSDNPNSLLRCGPACHFSRTTHTQLGTAVYFLYMVIKSSKLDQF